MGFGLLFFGFMMMLDTGWTISEAYGIGLDIFPDILGYLCMYRSMKHLRKSSRDLNIFAWITVALSVLGGVLLAGQITAAVMRFAYPAGLESMGLFIMICGYIKNPIMLAAMLFLTSGLRELANSLELYSLAKKTTAVSVISAAYYLLQSVFTVTSAGNISVPSVVFFGTALLFYVQLITVLALVFSFYRQVGYEGEDTSEKEHPLEKLRKKLMNAGKDEDDD
ncbi:MAG: hypothetical protein E7633_09085 [Ruminococcaceae bacterium]|nr:hypothetical protein [Oscillospiraceae bacterium]